MVSGALQRLSYLGLGLSFILGFVGIKMLVSNYYEIPTLVSLGIVLLALVTTVLASQLKTSGNPKAAATADSR